tara:strand:+ start:2262 stop:2963 length:702 start_codon:yes stop_codon:yes gene_type:complete
MKTYNRFLLEAREGKRAVFTFGRFNPPTTGHEKLIDAVKKESKGDDFYVYISHSQDSKKNPLDYGTKIDYLKKIFPKYNRNIVRTDNNIAHALHICVELYNKEYKNITMVVGSDRVVDFKKLLESYNGVKNKPHGFYNFDNIGVVSAGERDPDAENVSGMSASKMRVVAAKGDFEQFKKGIPSHVNDKIIKQLFNDVRKGMKLEVIYEKLKGNNFMKPDKYRMIRKVLEVEAA